MASTFFLAPPFKWYFLDQKGKPAANGTFATFSSLNHATPKPVFSDPGGVNAYPNPIRLDGSGGCPVPMYWEDDGVSRYYIEVREYAGPDPTGNLITSIDNFPIAGSGPAPPVTINTDVENYLTNGNFHFVIDTQFGGIVSYNPKTPITPVPIGITRVAPGSSTIDTFKPTSGIKGYSTGSVISLSGKTVEPSTIPGWVFIKTGGASLNDTIDFPFTDPGATIPSGPSANAPRYFRYKTTNAFPTTELDLTFVLPGARTFSDEIIQISFDAFCNGPSNQTEFIFEQVFGTGGTPSSSVPTSANFTFPNAVWQRINFQMSVPSVTGKLFGSNLDDFIRLRWRIPSNTIGEFGLTNLQLQRGNQIANTSYIYNSFNQTSYQVLADLISGHLPKTGDVKFSISPNASIGWIAYGFYGQTLGSVASGATFAGEEVRNLYRLIWNTFDDSNSPVSGGRGANADADFDANKKITLPPYSDRVIGVNNSIRTTLNTFEGPIDNNITISIDNLPTHHHQVAGTFAAAFQLGNNQIGFTNAGTIDTLNSGLQQPFSITQRTGYLWLHIKL